MVGKTRMNLHVSDGVVRLLDFVAESQGVSRSQLVETALYRYCSDKLEEWGENEQGVPGVKAVYMGETIHGDMPWFRAR